MLTVFLLLNILVWNSPEYSGKNANSITLPQVEYPKASILGSIWTQALQTKSAKAFHYSFTVGSSLSFYQNKVLNEVEKKKRRGENNISMLSKFFVQFFFSYYCNWYFKATFAVFFQHGWTSTMSRDVNRYCKRDLDFLFHYPPIQD